MLRELFSLGDRRVSRPVVISEPMKPQTREALDGGLSAAFNEYSPEKMNIGIFRMLRANIPLLNAAIIKRQLLIGGYDFETYGDKALKEKLITFRDTVRVNWLNQGLTVWWQELMDSADETGMGFGELIPLKSGKDIHRLKTCKSEDFRFISEKGTGQVRLAVKDDFDFMPIPFADEDRIFYLVFNQRNGHPQGYSLFWGLPFVGQILLRIMKAWDNSAWRFASPSMLVTVKGGKDQTYNDAKATYDSLLGSLKSIFQKRVYGQVADLGGAVKEGGDVVVKFLGGDQTIDEMKFSTDSILEQIVSATHIPPSLFGLSWATGSGAAGVTQGQIDILVSLINNQRERIESLIDRVVNTWLAMTGNGGKKWSLLWDEVNLQDEVRSAQARKFNAEAAEKEVQVQLLLVEQGLMTIQEAEDNLRSRGLLRGKINEEWLQKRLKILLAKSI